MDGMTAHRHVLPTKQVSSELPMPTKKTLGLIPGCVFGVTQQGLKPQVRMADAAFPNDKVMLSCLLLNSCCTPPSASGHRFSTQIVSYMTVS